MDIKECNPVYSNTLDVQKRKEELLFSYNLFKPPKFDTSYFCYTEINPNEFITYHE